MPPKKKQEEEKKPLLLGRLGTSLKIGIVGLPNVGKSTFFNVLTKSQVRQDCDIYLGLLIVFNILKSKNLRIVL